MRTLDENSNFRAQQRRPHGSADRLAMSLENCVGRSCFIPCTFQTLSRLFFICLNHPKMPHPGKDLTTTRHSKKGCKSSRGTIRIYPLSTELESRKKDGTSAKLLRGHYVENNPNFAKFQSFLSYCYLPLYLLNNPRIPNIQGK